MLSCWRRNSRNVVVRILQRRDGAASVVLCLCVIACGFPRPADVLPADGADDDPGAHEFQLLSLAPGIAESGDTITLEGTFDSTVVVNFPGGISRSAAVLGPHRATGHGPCVCNQRQSV